MTTIALFGAGGKMGLRLSTKLMASEFDMRYVEISQAGIEALAQLGLETTPQDRAVSQADVVILAVPDRLLGRIASQIVPQLSSGALVMCLDPAAPLAGELPAREDVAYFVVHPCHPPIPSIESDPEARLDFLGGDKARQHIVCALMQGSEKDYALGDRIARVMVAPVMNAHRVTVEQMALLEPALTETMTATCMVMIRDAMDEVIRRGVPAEAARDFLLGHINASIGIFFGFIDAEISDGAKRAVERAKTILFQPDWQRIFEPDNVLAQVQDIVKGEPGP